MERYYKTNAEDGTEIRVSTGYELGGMNYFSGETSRRGYYVYVQPVKRGESASGLKSMQTTLFDGFKEMLVEVGRASLKQELKAERFAEAGAFTWAQRMAAQKGLELLGKGEWSA